MDENTPRQPSGAVYRVTADGTIERKSAGYSTSNGLANIIATFDVGPTVGLGDADSARLFNGATLIDTFTWAAPAQTTWSRCRKKSLSSIAPRSIPSRQAPGSRPVLADAPAAGATIAAPPVVGVVPAITRPPFG